jgi:CTP synthase
VDTIYEVPLKMQEEQLDVQAIKKLGLKEDKEPSLSPWKDFVTKLKNPKQTTKIGLVGKYVELPDSYKSIMESFVHAGAVNECKVDLDCIHSEDITEQNYTEVFKQYKGILVAPGFGDRGIEGKILAAKYARENKIPFLGICLGMQCAVIEFAKNVLKLEKAHSTEMDHKTPYPVIDLMEEQKEITEKGGTMRLGSYPCHIDDKKSIVYQAYKRKEIFERHRHRYEFNNNFLEQFQKAGMQATGINPETCLVEIVELSDHPWFVGTQFHPEYSSTVLNPHPLFVDFVKSTLTK